MMRSLCFALPLGLFACVGGDDGVAPNDASTDTTTPNDAATNDVIVSADASDAADASGPFTPASFGADLALWLVADNVSQTAGVVDTWYDQSTYNTSPTQSDTASRPLLEQGTVNGHNVVDFAGNGVELEIDGAGDAGTTPSNLSFGQTDDFVIAAVVATTPSQPTAFFWFKAPLTKCVGVCTIGDGVVFGADLLASDDTPSFRISSADPYLAQTGSPLSDHSYHVVVARRIGDTQLQLRTDTTPTTKIVTSFDVSQPTEPLEIGCVRLGTFNGTVAFRIAEIVAVHRTGNAINDLDVSNIESYLKAKYKTP